ncbi:MAG: RuBisCO large subunit C-terminal-like domain-containing protein [Nitriliruptoraceae bacterium]
MMNSPLRPVRLDLTGDRILATYHLTGDPMRTAAVLEQLVVEQTIEFPADLVPDDDISRFLIADVRSNEVRDDGLRVAEVSYAAEIAGAQLPQLTNVLFGNISMVPGVRLVQVRLPEAFLSSLAGPTLGIEGLRTRFDLPHGPLLATALKPMGTPVADLARMAYDLAAGGLHLVKDDHSFATQPFATFRERVPALAAAVRRANEDRGVDGSVYLPALNLPADRLRDGLELAVEAGAGGVLVLPGLVGFDAMRDLAAIAPDELVVMAHPSFLGSHVTDPTAGLSHGLLFGTLARLAGADVSIFPNFGGRFSFSREACLEIATACRAPLGELRTAFPAPGGGMTVERVPEMLDAYGEDVCLLIGGNLYRGDIATQTRRMTEAVAAAS